MGRKVTAQELGLDDDYDPDKEGDLEVSKESEDKDSSEFKGSPEHGTIGAEVVADEVKEKERRQAKAEEDRRQEELKKIEGEEEEKEEDKEGFQYKDQAAAEKAIKEAKTKIREQGTRLKKLEVIAADLQKRVDSASKEAPPESGKENLFEVARQKIADETISQAAAIPQPTLPEVPDPDDPEYKAKSEAYKTQLAEYKTKMGEYNAKVARVWADAQAKIANLTADEREEAQRNKEIVSEAIQKALDDAKIGDIEGIEEVFWAQAAKVSKNKPLEDQIKEAVKLTQAIVDHIRGKEKVRADKEKENQEKLEVLGRGGRVITPKKEPESTQTMGEAQRVAREKRILRHSP